jgi:hypothetical protein
MLSAAILLGPGCADDAAPQPSKDEPLRRAGFRSLAAREFFASCPGAASGRDMGYQASRHEELKQLAARSGAGDPVALGENEWAGLSRNSPPERCEAGDEAYRLALAQYRGALDTLAARIADHPAQREPRP